MRALQIQTQTYERANFAFILSPKRVIIKTSLQTFFLKPRESYWYRRINMIRAMIEVGDIQTIGELAECCGSEIEWRVTSLSIETLVHNEDRYGNTSNDTN